MPKRPQKLSVLFSLMTFLTLVLTLFFTGALTALLLRLGLIAEGNRSLALCLIAFFSSIIGTALSHVAGKQPLDTISAINRATQKITQGDYAVALSEDIAIQELREMAQNFNRMAKELAGTELLRTDFVENVSHEFKTPLSAIEGYAVLLQRKGLSEEKREEYTRKILYNTKRLSALTSNILLLSRLENQELDIQKQLFCLDEQLREAILSLEESWTAKALELEIDLDSVDYCGSKDLLIHVWQNLLSNAVKFAPEQGKVGIRLRACADNLEICVADNGPGMKEAVRQRVFEKFYQGDRSRSSQGNGLGLALAKRIIDLHGGEVTVYSEEGKGAVFTVTLPANAVKGAKNDIL